MLAELKKDLRDYVNPEKAAFYPRFFKTGPGEYGEGDRFLGITVPHTRLVAKKYQNLPLNDIAKLIASPWHEERLTALHIMVLQFKSSQGSSQEQAIRQEVIYKFYLDHTERINNWDLVDCSARDIVGGYLFQHPAKLLVLVKLANSELVWERRIAIIATFYFITRGEPDITLKIATILLHDNHDLMHKAVGWMLREVGKRCGRDILVSYLAAHYKTMPRTTLRYAIEHFDVSTRQKYLNNLI